ncbi:NitT/TauT family transport system substrate-binding protein [Desulfonatronum zhilinae]|nr:NitT/TauT family transport system substrate-binding protein [Desulfonatronum zhilinae]
MSKSNDNTFQAINRRDFVKRSGYAIGAASLCSSGLYSLIKPDAAHARTDSIRLAYILSDHHAPFMLLCSDWQRFKDRYNIYLEPIAHNRIYNFYYEGEREATINVIAARQGPDLLRLMEQGSVDLSITGVQAIYMSVDRCFGSKLVSPYQSEGNAFVIRKGIDIRSWDQFVQTIKGTKNQFTIGVPGPVTSPAIIFKDGLMDAGITFTEDSFDRKADVVLMNMKGHGNVVPGMVNGITEALVGAQPFPATAVVQGQGHLILNLQDLPGRKWREHACCALEAGPSIMQNNPSQLVKLLELLVLSAYEAENDTDATAIAASSWLSVDLEVEKFALPTMGFSTEPTAQWLNTAYSYAKPMGELGVLVNNLKGKHGQEIGDLAFDFSYLELAKNNLRIKGYI